MFAHRTRLFAAIAFCSVQVLVNHQPAAADGLVWVSGDAGTMINGINFASGFVPEMSGTTENLYAVRFADPLNGWAVGAGVPGGTTILHTADGGAKWAPQLSPVAQNLFGAFFLDPQTGWAVGSSGAILHTTDGGGIWTDQSTGIVVDLTDVAFVNPQAGWAVGRDGVILHNTGTMWVPQVSGSEVLSIVVF